MDLAEGFLEEKCPESCKNVFFRTSAKIGGFGGYAVVAPSPLEASLGLKSEICLKWASCPDLCLMSRKR